MVTKTQAITERYFHYTGRSGKFPAGRPCARVIGPRGGITNVRASGKCQIWKTRPDEFRLPVKFGMYESSAITQDNAQDYHAAADCPILSLETERQ